MMNNNQPKNNISSLYFENSSLIRNLFEYQYKEPDSVYKRAHYLRQHRKNNGSGLIDALLSYNLLMGCGPKTLETLEAIKHRPWLAVVTGQQAGIMTGPLYSIYKAITAINLARHWEELLGLPVVPVFWIASEDHDFQEVSWVNYVNKDGKIVKYILGRSGNTGQSIGSIPISQDMEHMLDTLYNKSLEGRYKKKAFEILRKTLEQSKTMAEWYARIMALLFRDHGLVLLDPMDLELRKMSKDIFIQGIDNWEKINSIVENTGKAIAEMGLKVQVNIPPNSINLFHYDNGIRKPVAARDKEYLTKDGCVYFGDREGLKAKVNRYPWLFSPNVVLRPIVQEKLLPTLAYVAGPGEISYYAQFRGVYHVFNMEMPIIYPRNRLILLDSRCKSIMDRYTLSLKDISSLGLEEMVNRILQKKGFYKISQKLDDISKGINDQYDQLSQSIPFFKGREDIIRINFNKIKLQTEYLKGKLYYYFKKHNRELVRDFELLYNFIYPKDNDQDRELNIFTFVTQYGRGIIDFLMDNLPLDQKYPRFFLVISEDKINKDGG